jgi:rhodanese-related sulfurtransferase
MNKLNQILTFVFVVISLACGTSAPGPIGPAETGITVVEVSPQQAQVEVSKAYSQFIDVRTPEEFADGHADRARNIPLDTLGENLDLMRTDDPVYLICATGNRSAEAAQMLSEGGFSKVFSVSGGTDAWQAAGLPMTK